MKDAKCSLLLQDDVVYECKVKTLPKQRVLVYQDKSFHPTTTTTTRESAAANDTNDNNVPSTDDPTTTTTTTTNTNTNTSLAEDNFHVDFPGATILQLEPGLQANHKAMPVTLTVGGRCLFTSENYQDFRVMMRTKEQSLEMEIAPNGTFDWPDVESLLLCPVCGEKCPIPLEGDRNNNTNNNDPQEYWMLFYPLLQITVMKGSQMTLGTRTICRLTCLECMEDLLEGMTLTVQPGANKTASGQRRTQLAFTLPASDVLAEAGSASFLEDGPPRPDTHPHVDDILDGWTLYNLWEHSGAWEALQNDYRLTLAKSMHADQNNVANNNTINNNNSHPDYDVEDASAAGEPRLKERMGKKCANKECTNIHGRLSELTGEMVRLGIKCRECHSEFYCSKTCRESSKDAHKDNCLRKRREREERREKKAKKVECDTCHKKHPYTRMKKCSRCRSATYCCVQCQKDDWENHKEACQKILNETR